MATTEQVVLKGANEGRSTELLTPEALAFVGRLQRQFDRRRVELLRMPDQRQSRLDAGESPQFLADTQTIRHPEWKAGQPPRDVMARRVRSNAAHDPERAI